MDPKLSQNVCIIENGMILNLKAFFTYNYKQDIPPKS